MDVLSTGRKQTLYPTGSPKGILPLYAPAAVGAAMVELAPKRYTYSVSTGNGVTMLRKIFRTGNSIVVSIPRDILDELKLSEGEEVSIELDSQQRQIVISPIERPLAVGVDERFARQVDEFIKEYRPALEALAK